MRDFFGVCDRWGLRGIAQRAMILDVSPPQGAQDFAPDDWSIIGDDGTVERASCVLAIDALLLKMLRRHESINIWLTTPCDRPPFNGRSAIGKIMNPDIDGMKSVLEYLVDQSKFLL